MDILKVENLNIKDNSGLSIIKNVSFNVKQKDIFGILGSNGSGKTLLNLALFGNLNADFNVNFKKIIFNNKNLKELTLEELQKIKSTDIKYVFQDTFASFNPLKKISEEVKTVKKNSDFLKILKDFGITNLNKYPKEYSLGLLQRINILLALYPLPKLVIMDEPFNQLDKEFKGYLIKFLKELVEKNDLSIIIIDHDLDNLKKLVNNYIFLDNGELKKLDIEDITTSFKKVITKDVENANVILKVNNLEVRNIKDFNLKIKTKDNMLLKGANGSGKTSIINALARLIKYKGSVFFESVNIKNINNQTYYKNLQVILQNNQNTFLDFFTVKENLMLPLNNFYKAVKLEAKNKMILEFLECFKINANILQKKPKELSNGERQKLAILRAFLVKPKFLIMDEVFNNLDIHFKKTLIDFLESYQNKNDVTYLFTSHNTNGLEGLIKNEVLI